MKNIVLCGLPGSGKTALGSHLARQAGLPFVDLDAQVEAMAGRPVSAIFAGYGEDFFRELETLALRRAAEKGGQIIATGGGAVLRAQNVEALRRNGVLVFNNRPVEAIAADIAFARRPLLRDGEAALRALSAKRHAAYRACADFVLENTAGFDKAAAQLHSLYLGLSARGLAVIGDPVGHSLSPVIHRALLAARGLCVPYAALHVPRGHLPAFMAGVRQGGLLGYSITLPHKKEIIPLLDGVDGEAARYGAVNTVVRAQSGWQGHNTDMQGLEMALRQAGGGFENARVLVLGTGGAAVAVAHKAAASGAAAVAVQGRNEAAARGIAQGVSGMGYGGIQAGHFSAQSLCDAAGKADLLINATPLGMTGFGRDFESFAFLKALPPGALVCDLVYTPPQTTLLQRAAALGLATLNGLSMLVWQAVLAQELFFGKADDRQVLYEQALECVLNEMEAAL